MSTMTTISRIPAVRYHSRLASGLRSGPLLGVACAALFLSLSVARAGYHLWDINEVYSSPDGKVQFIELRALGGGQQFFANAVTIRATNSIVTNTFTCTTHLPGDSGGKTCIFGTASLATVPGGVTPNYIIPQNFLPTPVSPGSAGLSFLPSGFTAQQVHVVYTNLANNGDSALLRSGGSMIIVPTNSPKNFSDQANSIVPVKIKSIGQLDTDFLLSFATASGPNGSAGPNYAVEFTDAITNTTWQTLANVGGSGAVKTVTNSSPPDAQRFYRLRVP